MKKLLSIWIPVLVSCGNNPQSFTGLDGKPGVPGSSCTVAQGPEGATITCTDGTSAIIHNGLIGATGPQGPIGIPGLNGNDGSNGNDGAPGTVITAVDLCPGVTTYPSVFIETSLCIGGNLYGVYSANGGFLTYLAPGNYSSNAIGSACNFTVGPNCTVSH